MENSIKVPVQLDDGSIVSIPLLYSVNKDNERVVSIRCKVNLPTNEIPEWLAPNEFAIRSTYSDGNPGVTVTEMVPNHFKTPNAAFLANAAGSQIRIKEKLTDRQ